MLPTFGVAPPEGAAWTSRRCVHAVIVDADLRIALLDTPDGLFLPGGEVGSEGPEATIRAFIAHHGLATPQLFPRARAGDWEAVPGGWIRWEADFFVGAASSGVLGTATWLRGSEARRRLARESHAYAVHKALSAC